MTDPRTIEQFLYREARLMDTHAYDDWYALWAEDATYWLPCNLDDYDPANHVSLVYEDHDGLKDRIDRLKSGQALAQDPKSRLSRVVSNIEIEPGDPLIVHSAFNITASRHGRLEVLAGRTEHRLREAPDGLRIVFKKVMLVDNDEVMSNLTFLI
jgi:3-phenylpropionate/cinnamic acid dioxygenase small subunit